MKSLAWNDNYLIGCELVDEEHKKLFEISNRAFKAVVKNEKLEKIKIIVHELIEYTQVHFKDEENFMQRVDYPSFIEHKNIHKHIITSMNKFLATINQKEINELERELAHFIQQWFISHIVYEDKKIAKWAYEFDPKSSIQWKSIYKIGHKELDEDHQKFFHIMEDFFSPTVYTSRKEHLNKTLYTLEEYLTKHFQTEETFMHSLNFNELQEHKALHESLLQELKRLIEEGNNLEFQPLYDSFLDFIQKDFFLHLQKEDAKIGNWMKFLSELKEANRLNDIE